MFLDDLANLQGNNHKLMIIRLAELEVVAYYGSISMFQENVDSPNKREGKEYNI